MDTHASWPIWATRGSRLQLCVSGLAFCRPRWDGGGMAVTRAVTADLQERRRKKKKEKKKQANVNPGRNVSRFARAPGACLPQPPVIRGQRAALGRSGSAGPGTALTGAQPHRCRRTTAAIPAPSLRPLSGAGPALSHASPRPAAAHVLLHPSPIRPDGGRSADARCPPQPRFATPRFAPRRPPRPPMPSCRAPRPRGRWVRGGHLGGGRGRGAARRGCGATRLPAPSVRRAGSCGGREGARQRERRGAAGRASAGMRRGCRRGGGCRAAGRGQTAGRCGHRGSAVPGPARAVRTVEGWERVGARRRAQSRSRDRVRQREPREARTGAKPERPRLCNRQSGAAERPGPAPPCAALSSPVRCGWKCTCKLCSAAVRSGAVWRS